jgi:hypothetical protein
MDGHVQRRAAGSRCCGRARGDLVGTLLCSHLVLTYLMQPSAGEERHVVGHSAFSRASRSTRGVLDMLGRNFGKRIADPGLCAT